MLTLGLAAAAAKTHQRLREVGWVELDLHTRPEKANQAAWCCLGRAGVSWGTCPGHLLMAVVLRSPLSPSQAVPSSSSLAHAPSDSGSWRVERSLCSSVPQYLGHMLDGPPHQLPRVPMSQNGLPLPGRWLPTPPPGPRSHASLTPRQTP